MPGTGRSGNGICYYRLRQVDLDGAVVYSAVITLSRSAAATASKVAAYPNPFADQLSVALPGTSEPMLPA